MNVKIIAATIVALTLNLLVVPTVSAESRWINDKVLVPLRSGQGNQFRIIRNLKTGTPLTLLQTDKKSGWSNVKTMGGTSGWLPSQYLSRVTPPSLQLVDAKKKIESLTAKHNELKQSLQTTSSEFKDTQANLSDLSQENNQLKKELDEIKIISRNAVKMHAQHQVLLKAHKVLETDLDVMKSDNERLRSDRSVKFFVYGVAAVLIGVLLAIILPNLRRKKKFSEWA